MSLPVDYLDSVVSAMRARGLRLDELQPLTQEESEEMECYYRVGYSPEEAATLLSGGLVTPRPVLDVHAKALAETRAKGGG